MNRAYDKLLLRLCTLPLIAASLGGCAILNNFQPSVAVRPITPNEYITLQRGDILVSRQLSALTIQTIRVAGLNMDKCVTHLLLDCTLALTNTKNISDERKLSALAELWLQQAISMHTKAAHAGDSVATLAPWMEVARYAYAYLFFTQRTPGERAFEDRQTQVRDWYNYAVQQAIMQLFKGLSTQARITASDEVNTVINIGGWAVHLKLNARQPEGIIFPQELLPTSSLAFQGLRSIYRRDGFGAELVAVMDHKLSPRNDTRNAASSSGSKDADRSRMRAPPWSEMPSPNMTAVFSFDAKDLDELVHVREVTVSVHDPLIESQLMLHGHRVPLAGNFTAGYGLWLARSGFSRQSLHTLFGREHGIEHPHIYMMQPYDPDRRIILMLHGLASSPEAWVNMTNEILGDEELRREFQVWLVSYPTNMPVIVNHATIRRLLQETLRNFDPHGQAVASRGLVVVGHSMGGLIARLMVSSAKHELWDWALTDSRINMNATDSTLSLLDPILRFQPFPGVTRTVFIATPHRGTAVAGYRPARWLSGLIRLPLTALETIGDALHASAMASSELGDRILEGVPNSIDNLDERDPFIKAAVNLPISDQVLYHSIIARSSTTGALEDSDDSLVPYKSSHLTGAVSEKIIIYGHSVQEAVASILEVRRILQEDITAHRRTVELLEH
ncbi:esterase/lipase family protein [Advenella faeciporci]|nr:alpha/beta fold hydrolase [Advenella faeciporci]